MGQNIVDSEFQKCIAELLSSPVVQQMRQYPHHGEITCYIHCLHVAYGTYRLCRLFRLHASQAARAGMLHDLFLYDWHTHAKQTGARFHGLTHPQTALENAQAHFALTPLEKDMILRHMWPLTLTLPRYPESYVICLVDKYCCIAETLGCRTRRLLHIIGQQPLRR